VRQAFRLIDKNGDGSLDVKEICAVLRKYKYDQDESLAHEIFEAIDRDVSNNLSFAEFTAVSIGTAEYSNRQTLWHTFNRFDKEQKGYVTKSEVSRLLRQVEHTTEAEFLEAETEAISKDVKMPMDFDAFVVCMTTMPGQEVNKMYITLSQCCNTLCKQDIHGVRHLSPKTAKPQAASALSKPMYSRVTRISYESTSPGGQSGRKSSRASAAAKRKKFSTWDGGDPETANSEGEPEVSKLDAGPVELKFATEPATS